VTDAAQVAAERAHEAWHALEQCLVRSGGWVLAKDGPGRRAPVSALWPFGQVIAAGAAMLGLGAVGAEVVEPMVDGLEHYRVRDAYGAFPLERHRYYDDNAWIALDHLQLVGLTGDPRHLDAGVALFAFLAEGEGTDGGVRWVEGDPSRNTCSTGPAAQVALRLHEQTGERAYLEFAERQMVWLDRVLRDEEGLYRDNLGGDGSIEPTVWSYNQGTPIGASVLLARFTGEAAWLERARATAVAARRRFGEGDRLWESPPVFNAILFRNLLALASVAPEPVVPGLLDDYLERAWHEGRDRRTGLFTSGGIGSYDRNPTIDHAGLTQLYAFRAWPQERWAAIC
jgi:hypothetical protein